MGRMPSAGVKETDELELEVLVASIDRMRVELPTEVLGEMRVADSWTYPRDWVVLLMIPSAVTLGRTLPFVSETSVMLATVLRFVQAK